MKKVTIDFEITDDYDIQECLQALSYKKCFRVFDQITQQVFRPARKHGYHNYKIQQLLEKCGDAGYELVGLLEETYLDILREEEIMDLLD